MHKSRKSYPSDDHSDQEQSFCKVKPIEYLRFSIILIDNRMNYNIMKKMENKNITASNKEFHKDFNDPEIDINIKNILNKKEIENVYQNKFSNFKDTFIQKRSMRTFVRMKERILKVLQATEEKVGIALSFIDIGNILPKKNIFFQICCSSFFRYFIIPSINRDNNNIDEVNEENEKLTDEFNSDIEDIVEEENKHSLSSFENKQKKKKRVEYSDVMESINSVVSQINNQNNSQQQPNNDKLSADSMFMDMYRIVMTSGDEASKKIASEVMQKKLMRYYSD